MGDGKRNGENRKAKSRGQEKAHRAKSVSESDSDETESDEQAHVTTALKRCIGAYLGGNVESDQNSILLDSGASTMMTPSKDWFHSFKPLSPPQKIQFRDDSIVYATGQGTILLKQNAGNMTPTTTIRHTLLVPAFKVTLLSVHHLTKGGYCATFKGETAKLQQIETHQVVMTAKHNHGLYHV